MLSCLNQTEVKTSSSMEKWIAAAASQWRMRPMEMFSLVIEMKIAAESTSGQHIRKKITIAIILKE
jgi:hypothetical protein